MGLQLKSRAYRIGLLLILAIAWAESWCYKTKFAGADKIMSIDFSPDGQYILTAEQNGRILLWNAQTFDVLKVYIFPTTAQQAKFSKDQTQVAIGGDQDDVYVLNFPAWTLNKTLDTDLESVKCVDFNYNSDVLMTGGKKDKELLNWANKATYSKLATYKMHHEV